MESQLYLIDHNANNGTSLFHKASLPSKLILVLVCMAVLLSSQSMPRLLLFLGLELLMVALSRVDPAFILSWSLYPLVFVLMFAVSQPSNAALVVIRSYDMVLLSLLFINTTSYARLFEALSYISVTLSNVAFLSYRFFFLLASRMEESLAIMEVRGATGMRRVKALADLVGGLLLEASDRAERVYEIMVVRGYSGRIRTLEGVGGFSAYDIPVLLLSGIALVGAVVPW